MYFYELLNQCDIEVAISMFLEMCVNSPDIKHTEEAVRSAVADMKKLEAKKSDCEILGIERIVSLDEDDEDYDAAYMYNTNENIKYGFEVAPWDWTLGYMVDETSLSRHGSERFVALVLWEMTWFGYDEETIQEHIKAGNKWNFSRDRLSGGNNFIMEENDINE